MSQISTMNVCILAGGMGTRLQEETGMKPKPMVEVGGRPILWHIMKIFGAYGLRRFNVALGYKGEMIKQYFLNYRHSTQDIEIDLQRSSVKVTGGSGENWIVRCQDTGLHTGTGGRLKRLSSTLRRGTFLMTYGDGVSDVDIDRLLAFHRRQKRLATLLAVRPPARFGALEIKKDAVVRFAEKPQLGEGWINGGFFVLEPEVLDYIDGDDVMFEREPLVRLAREGQLAAMTHEGFWQCMDTLRDVRLLNSLWEEGKPAWKVW